MHHEYNLSESDSSIVQLQSNSRLVEITKKHQCSTLYVQIVTNQLRTSLSKVQLMLTTRTSKIVVTKEHI